ncbi:GDP/GTP exchange factor for ARF, partial [Ascosphaera aggregata]
KHNFIRAPVVLHSIASLDHDIIDSVAIPVISGLDRCVSGAIPLRNEVNSSPDFWSILQRYHRHPEAASLSLDILHRLVAAETPVITADNYEFAVALANDFASVGGLPTIAERKLDSSSTRNVRNHKPQQPLPQQQ